MTRANRAGPRWQRFGALAGTAVLMTSILMILPPAADAQTTTITVTTTADSATTTACTTSCPTLRDAAAEANSLSTSTTTSSVTIVLPSGTTDISDGFITIGSATNLDFILTGPTSSAGGAVIEATGSPANQGAGILQTPTVAGVNATFENLTMTGGVANSNSFGGGAILTGYSNTQTTVTNCVFTNNTSAAPAGGGAIANEGGPDGGAGLTVTDSTFTGNSTSVGPGGAVLSENNAGTTSSVSFSGDTFSNNTASSPAADGGAFGGAAQVLSASLTITGSSFVGNVAQITGSGAPAEPPSGGALYIGSDTSATIGTSTFLNNSTSAAGEGGAIFNNDDTLTIANSRLVGNTSDGGHGDAVVNETNGGTVTATDNWWGQNTGPSTNEVNSNGGTAPTTAPYLELAIAASPSTINVGGTSNVTAGLLNLSDGTAVASGALDGLTDFTGTLNGQSVTYVNGVATTTFTGTATGSFPVSATADNQTVSTSITVQTESLQVVISGLQDYGSSSPEFRAQPRTGSLPSGVSISGTPTCTTVNAGTPITPTLPAGDYVIDISSCSGVSLSGPNAGDYTLSLLGSSFLVNQTTLFVSVSGSQTFGSSSPSFTPSPEEGQLPAGVSFSGTLSCTEVNSGTPLNASLPAGTYSVNGGSCSGLILSGPNGGDYQAILVGGTFTVSPASLSITVTGSQTFGSSSPTFTAAATSGTLPDGVTLNGTPSCTTVNSGTPIDPSLPAGGTYTIDAPSCTGVTLSGANAGDYTVSLVGASFLVNPASLSVTVTGSQTFGSSPTFVASPTSGTLPDGVTLNGTPACTTVNSGTPIDPSLPAGGTYTIDGASCSGVSLSGANAGDYTLNLQGGSFLVSPASLSITVTGSQTFGSSSPTFTAAPSSGTLPDGVTLNGTPTCITVSGGLPIGPSLPAGGTYTIDAGSCTGVTLSGTNAGDYTVSLVGGTFTVTPASLSITVSGSQTFGSSPTFVASPTSGTLPDGVTLNGTPACTTVNAGTPIDPTLPAAIYTIDGSSCTGVTLSGTNAGDYTVSLVGGSFLVNPASLSITVTGSQTFGSSSPTFVASPTSGTLPDGVTLNGTPACTTVNAGTPIDPTLPAAIYTIDGSSCSGVTLSGTNAGDYTVSLVGGSFLVSPASLSITVTGSQTFGSSSPTFTAAPTSGTLPDGVTLNGMPFCATVNSGTPITPTLPADGTYTIDGSSCSGVTLSGTNAGDYTVSLVGGTLTVTPGSLALLVTGSQTFGSSSPTFTVGSLSPLPSGVSVTGLASCTQVNTGAISSKLAAGFYTIDPTSCTGVSLSGPNAADYTFTLSGGSFVVNPVAIVSGSQTFGSSSPSFTINVPSLPPGVRVTGKVTCKSVTSGAPINSKLDVGSYTIDATSCSGLHLSGGINARQFTLVLTGGPFVVHRRHLVVTVTGSQRFGSSSPTFTYRVASLPPGVALAGTKVSCTAVDAGRHIQASLPIGTYLIDGASCSGLTLTGHQAANYRLLFTGTFRVTRDSSHLSVVFSPHHPTAGQGVTFTVSVTGGDPPSGTVTFTLGSTRLGTAHLDAEGRASFVTSRLPAGTDRVTIAYSGDHSFSPAAVTVTIDVASGLNTGAPQAGVAPIQPAVDVTG